MTTPFIRRLQWRAFTTCTCPLRSVYDPKAFAPATVDLDELRKTRDPSDSRKFLFIEAMKRDQSPVFYRDHTVDKLVNVCTNSGHKAASRSHVLSALELIKRRQYKAWRAAESEEAKARIELDPFKITRRAIRNCQPLMKLYPHKRGGITYMVPIPLKEAEAEFRAMKMMRDICRTKAKGGETHFEQILASELLAAFRHEGLTIQAKQELHKQCEANRAFTHFRSGGFAAS